MYIPAPYRQSDPSAMLALIAEYPFGILTSADGSNLHATHLPFLAGQNDEGFWLQAHISAANPHLQMLKSTNAIHKVIFSGPNGFVSTAHYAQAHAVPTWDYIAVHASGSIALIDDLEEARVALKTVVNHFQPEVPWDINALPEDYQAGLLTGLQCFRMPNATLEGAWKLSQDKPRSIRMGLANHFIRSSDTRDKKLGAEIKNSFSKG